MSWQKLLTMTGPRVTAASARVAVDGVVAAARVDYEGRPGCSRMMADVNVDARMQGCGDTRMKVAAGRARNAQKNSAATSQAAAAAPTELSSSFLVWLWRKKLLRLRRQRCSC